MSHDANATKELPLLSYAEPSSRLLEEFMAGLTPEVQGTVQRSFERLLGSGVGSQAKRTGDQAPDFALPNVHGQKVQLSDLLADGPVVLSFYRGGWCPFCNLEFRALSVILPEIRNLGATLVGVSPETPDNSLSTVEKNDLDFEVLSDFGNQVTREYGLLMQVYEEMRPLYLEWGLDIPAHNGDNSWELPLPATYVIDRNGIIQTDLVDKNYTHRMEPIAIIAALRQLQTRKAQPPLEN